MKAPFTPAVPDLIQAVLGYRTWAVDGDGWLLPFSLGTIAGPWRPGVNHASCHYAKWRGDGTKDVHAAPHPRCMCGLYALADPHDPRLPRSDPEHALGAIGAWGDLEVHRDGFRAEYATVLALAVAPDAPPHLRRRHERAARRYGVELVAPELLEPTGLKHAAPIPESLLPGAPRGRPGTPSGLVLGPPRPTAPRGRARRAPAPVAGRVARVTPAGRGFRLEDHVWLDAATLRCGITDAFARRLGGAPLDLALPSAGTLHRTSDALAHLTGASGETLLAWPPLTAVVKEVNPALADDPGLLLADPEGDGWLATLIPTAWAAEAGGLEWGPRGAAAYRAALATPDPWADLRSTAVHVRSAEEVLGELRRRRAAPRFADADAVHAELMDPLQRALAADPAAAADVARLGLRIAFALRGPDAAFVLDATGPLARVEAAASRADAAPAVAAGPPAPSAAPAPRTPSADAAPAPPPDLTLTLTAADAERLLAGRLDIARALKAGELGTDLPLGRTLAIASVLSGLPKLRSSAAPPPPIRT